ncbi:unnamed protein product, partial [Mesorhabditis belari]|uniref:Uncharacterized protein n=1 Tax=Mesorhabditis belari TaxID=2138241 RepID=A0AAF3J8R4_9BILA
MGFWLMKPNKTIDKIPEPGDYRIQPCTKFSSKAVFTVITFLYVLLTAALCVILLAKQKVFDIDPSILEVIPFSWVTFVIAVFYTFICIITIKTLKPGFAQLLIPVTVILVVFCLFDLFGRLENQKNQKYDDGLEEILVKIKGIMQIMTLLSIFLWCFNLLYSFYSYIRDCQLYKEQTRGALHYF